MLFRSITTVLFLFAAAFLLAAPKDLARGMVIIVLTRDALVTDYFELAGFGAAFLNAGLVMGLAILLIRLQKIPFTGLTMAVLFINAGFALFGKNPVNILPMLFGTWLYARFHRTGMNRYIYTALFGSCLAPMVTELVYLLPFSFPASVLGMLVLLALLLTGLVKPRQIQQGADLLLANMMFLFLPAGVSIMEYFPLIRDRIPVLILIALATLFLTLAVTAFTVRGVAALLARGRGEGR